MSFHTLQPAKASQTAGAGTLLLSALCITATLLSGCSGKKADVPESAGLVQEASTQEELPSLVDVAVMRDEDFGNIDLDITIDDFNALGFEFGDALDITFSNGYELKNIPYYNGYYCRIGEPLLVGYPGYPHVRVAVNLGDPLWETSGVTTKDTATVTIAKRGEYRATQEVFEMAYSDERSDYASDEIFANFRACTGGSLKKDWVYRSASPVDNQHQRAAFASKLAADNGVNCILDLADNEKEIEEFLEQNQADGVDVSYFTILRDEGNVIPIDLGAAYPSESYRQSLAEGLTEMSEHQGPYLIHCTEGKDRTGFVCLLLEALTGASREEMEADYMTTYANYYDITRENDELGYTSITDLRLSEMFTCLASYANADPETADYAEGARAYLRSGGMTDEQIDALVKAISD